MPKKKATGVRRPPNPQSLALWEAGNWPDASPNKIKYYYCRSGHETLASIAGKLSGKATGGLKRPNYAHNLKWQDITLLNFGTSDPFEVNWYLEHFNGCGRRITADRYNYGLDPNDDRPWLWIPTAQNRAYTSSGRSTRFVKKTPKEIVKIKMASLAFTTSYDLLLDNNTTWYDSGSRYPKPEWTPTRSCPITHAKGESVKVKVDLEVSPTDAKAATGQLQGKGPAAYLTFEVPVKLEKGQGTATLEAKDSLPDVVSALRDKRIKWAITAAGKTFDLGTTGPHTIYATYGKPNASYVTDKRVAQVVKATEGKTKEQDCVNAIFDDMMRFHYHLGAPYPDPVWLIYDGVTKAECNALADLFKQSCLMLGLPDKFELGHIYPLTSKAGGKFDVSGSANEKRNVASTHAAAVASAHGQSEELGFRDFSTRSSPYEGWNNFEGAVKYGSEYYCIGEGRYGSPTETMQRMVVATAWFSDLVGFCRNPGPCPEAIWNANQWSSIPRPC